MPVSFAIPLRALRCLLATMLVLTLSHGAMAHEGTAKDRASLEAPASTVGRALLASSLSGVHCEHFALAAQQFLPQPQVMGALDYPLLRNAYVVQWIGDAEPDPPRCV